MCDDHTVFGHCTVVGGCLGTGEGEYMSNHRFYGIMAAGICCLGGGLFGVYSHVEYSGWAIFVGVVLLLDLI